QGEHARLCRSRLVDGEYQEPEDLAAQVNFGQDNYNGFVARDESYLVYCVADHESNLGETDYYICFRDEDDSWSEAVNLGEPFNAVGARASSACVSPDGKYFFYATDQTNEAEVLPDGKLTVETLRRLHSGAQNGSSDIYWVEADFLEGLRP
ncbi:MAG: hypothetical protein ABIF77_01710, partial [bacterium]